MNKTKVKTPVLANIDKYQKRLIMAEIDLTAEYRLQARLMNLGRVEDIRICRRLRANRARCLTYVNQLEALAKTEFSPKQLKLITDRIDKIFK